MLRYMFVFEQQAERIGPRYQEITSAWQRLDVNLYATRIPEELGDRESMLKKVESVILGYEALSREVIAAYSKTSWTRRYLEFKNQQRLAMAYWRKALMLVAAELANWSEANEPSLHVQQVVAMNQCIDVYEKSLQADTKHGHAYRILGESVKSTQGFR